METSWLQSSATVTFLLQLFTRTSLGCILLKLGSEIFHSGTILAWTEGSLGSLFWGAKTKIYIYKYVFLFKEKKKNPQTSNTFHHSPLPPVLIKRYLRLRGCSPHKFWLSSVQVKAFLCMGPSALQDLAAQLHKDAGSKLHQLVLAAWVAHCSLCELAALGCVYTVVLLIWVVLLARKSWALGCAERVSSRSWDSKL